MCVHCKRDEHDDRLLMCSRCDVPVHTYCLTPALRKVPKGDWFCTASTSSLNAQEDEDEVLDDEDDEPTATIHADEEDDDEEDDEEDEDADAEGADDEDYVPDGVHSSADVEDVDDGDGDGDDAEVDIPHVEAIINDAAAAQAQAAGKVVWYYQPGPIVPLLGAPMIADPVFAPPLPPPVPIPAGAAIVPWNNGRWIIINGHWFYLKRWLGNQQQIASVYSRLSRPQAVALLDGFCRADGSWKSVRYDAQGEPTGQWRCSNSSFPLIDHLQLIGQLAGAAVDLHLHTKAGMVAIIEGRTVTLKTDHWQLFFDFTKPAHTPMRTTALAQPVDVSADTHGRGYYQYDDDNRVYCITVRSNGDEDTSNFLTQRLACKRLASGGVGVRAHSVFVGNCLDGYRYAIRISNRTQHGDEPPGLRHQPQEVHPARLQQGDEEQEHPRRQDAAAHRQRRG